MRVLSECLCDAIGTLREIRFCEDHHRYFYGDRELCPVTHLIRDVYPTDYSTIDPMVLEHARERGLWVDRYFTQYLRTDQVTIQPEHFGYQRLFDEVRDRTTRLAEWWDRQRFRADRTQQIVFADDVAGTLDVAVGRRVMDVKCVWNLQPSYSLQLGAYLTLGDYEECGIIHVQKDTVRYVPYDAEICRRRWSAAYHWWHTRKELDHG